MWVRLSGAAEARVSYAPGRGSVLRVEGTVGTADKPNCAPYEGLITGNSWGIAGAMAGTHGTLLLFPDIDAINRQAAVVYDVSNQGRRLLAGAVGVGFDAVPNRLNLSATVAAASDMRRELMGVEVNGRVEGEVLPFLLLRLSGAGVLGSPLPVTPWTLVADLSWVVF